MKTENTEKPTLETVKFLKGFDKYVCDGDTIKAEASGYEFTARIQRDEDYRIDDDDCHNPDQSVTGCNDEQFKKLLEARTAWFNDEWFYCGVVVSVSYRGTLLNKNTASLWGIEANHPEGDNSYLLEVANDLLQEAIPAAVNERDQLIKNLTE